MNVATRKGATNNGTFCERAKEALNFKYLLRLELLVWVSL